MSNFNKVFLLGRIGNIPEVKQSAVATPYLVLSVATNSYRSTDKKATHWHRVVVFGSLAEICGRYLAKGAPVFVEGSLEVKTYTDNEGKKKTRVTVIGTNIQFLDKPHYTQPLEEPNELTGDLEDNQHGGEEELGQDKGFEEDLKNLSYQ